MSESSIDEASPKTPLLKTTPRMESQANTVPTTESRQRHLSQNDDNDTVEQGPSDAPNRPTRSRARDSEADDEDTLKYGAKHVMMLFVPVIMCMAMVVITMTTTNIYQFTQGYQLPYVPFRESSDQSGWTNTWHVLMNALIVLGVVVVMTVVLVLLYKYRCYKILFGWLYIATGMLLFFFSYLYLVEMLTYFNIPLDFITGGFMLWNFGVVGMIAVHWKAPLILQQGYLIITSALTALLFIRFLPEWTGWTVLGIIALWDLVAVLCPMGPLRILVNIAVEREETLFPALIYSSTVVYGIGMNKGDDESSEPKRIQDSTQGASESETIGGADAAGDNLSTGSVNSERARAAQQALNHRQQPEEDDDDERGVKLGLGDFIFYSLLVGKASTVGDWNTTIACSIAILMGLCFTLLLLAIYRKALPALPISIAFGLIFYFGTRYFIQPFMEALQTNQVFI